MLSLITLITGILLFALGFFTRRFKLAMLISGYNTAPKHVKETYDIDKLTRLVGNLLMLSSLALILGGLLSYFVTILSMFIISWSAYLVIIFAGLIYLNTKGRVKK
jgi:uncharacterized membrane protein